MSNTAILVLISIVAVAGIFWLVIYSGRRGREHREKLLSKLPSLTDRALRVDQVDSSHLNQSWCIPGFALVRDGNPARRGSGQARRAMGFELDFPN
jgi:hypothetical protein